MDKPKKTPSIDVHIFKHCHTKLTKLGLLENFPIRHYSILVTLAVEDFAEKMEDIFSNKSVSDNKKAETRKELQGRVKKHIRDGTIPENTGKWDDD